MAGGNKKGNLNSPEEQARLAAAAVNPINPPEKSQLSARATHFFYEIIAEKGTGDWTGLQIETAVFLARAMEMMEENQNLLTKEGSLTSKGKISPRVSILERISNKIIMLRRTLGIHCGYSTKKQMMERNHTGRENDKKTQRIIKDSDNWLFQVPH